MKMRVLTCGHCGVGFDSTDRQWTNFQRAEKQGKSPKSYCSNICRATGVGDRFRKETPVYGPCPGCEIYFKSRYRKTFCGMKCLTKSEGFLERVRSQVGKATAAAVLKKTGSPLKPRVEAECLECGVKYFERPSRKSKFCSHNHYRAYFEKRFDRWMASPQGIALPQSYDEFMLQNELPCLIDGCGWVGMHLGTHMNSTHGITAKEFKRAAGFNLKTGLVNADLSQRLSERPHLKNVFLSKRGSPGKGTTRGYISKEAIEHAKKARALLAIIGDKPKRICKTCGDEFTQSTIFGKTIYCSVTCQNKFYSQNKGITVLCECGECGKVFPASRHQVLSSERGNLVFCNIVCRQGNNGRQGRATLKASKTAAALDRLFNAASGSQL